MGRLAKGPFPPELWDWAMGQIPRIAARCDRAFRQDIEAQLAIKLLQISRNANLRADDWKKYIYVSLSNRAVYLAKAWHKKRSLETALDAYAEMPAAVDNDSAKLECVLELEHTRQKMPSCCFEFLRQFEECGENVSLLAKHSGQHRNTVRRHMNKIRQGKCPGHFVTVRDQVQQIASEPQASLREALRARIALALLDGSTAMDTTKKLEISRPTVSRWRARFRRYGVAGLKGQQHGSAPSPHRTSLAKWLRATGNRDQLSLRQLGRRFGISKSTAHVILKEHMVHISRRRTLSS